MLKPGPTSAEVGLKLAGRRAETRKGAENASERPFQARNARFRSKRLVGTKVCQGGSLNSRNAFIFLPMFVGPADSLLRP